MQRLLSGSKFFKSSGADGLAIAASAYIVWVYEFDVPLGPEWSASGAAWTTSVAGGILTASTSSGGSVFFSPLPTPLTNGSSITARLRQTGGDYVGIAARGANGKSFVGAITSGGGGSYIQRIPAGGGFDANYTGTISTVSTNTYNQHRVLVSGTNILYQGSTDGVSWTTYATAPLADLGGSITGAGFFTYSGTIQCEWILASYV